VAFAPSSVVPGADGKVKLKKDDNKNYQIEVDVVNLASPDRLTPPKGYVCSMDEYF
jgi:hypothetical protein